MDCFVFLKHEHTIRKGCCLIVFQMKLEYAEIFFLVKLFAQIANHAFEDTEQKSNKIVV